MRFVFAWRTCSLRKCCALAKYFCVLTDYYSPDMKAVKIDQEVLGELIKLVTVYIVK